MVVVFDAGFCLTPNDIFKASFESPLSVEGVAAYDIRNLSGVRQKTSREDTLKPGFT
jgi:hypothetical protein